MLSVVDALHCAPLLEQKPLAIAERKIVGFYELKLFIQLNKTELHILQVAIKWVLRTISLYIIFVYHA